MPPGGFKVASVDRTSKVEVLLQRTSLPRDDDPRPHPHLLQGGPRQGQARHRRAEVNERGRHETSKNDWSKIAYFLFLAFRLNPESRSVFLIAHF